LREELERQAFHLSLGIAALIVLLLLGRPFLIAGSFFIILIGFLFVNKLLLGKNAFPANLFVKRFERPNAIFPGWGSANYGLGVLLVSGLVESAPQVAAALIILALGDGFSTLIGKKGNVRLPWNKRKTLEGSIAFVIGSLPAYYFIGPMIIPLAIIAALVESIDWPLDDNLMIPLACTIFFWAV
jgi:dolichol kinase